MGCVSSVSSKELLQEEDDFHLEYIIGKRIGQGAFGQVRLACSKRTLDSHAVKIVKLQSSRRDIMEAASSAQREFRVWNRIGRHDNCVQLLKAFAGLSAFYFVMERCRASLIEGLQQLPALTECQLADIFRQMLLGVGHLHQKGIVHRDVKPGNFLFGSGDAAVIKLCDFGMAALVPKDGGTLRGCFGTPPYMSPEMSGSEGHSANTDVWSLGATTYTILFGDFPYMPAKQTSKAFKAAIITGYPEPTFSREKYGLPPPWQEAVTFVKALLHRDRGVRCSVSAALKLPFLNQQSKDLSAATFPDKSTGQPKAAQDLLEALVASAESERCNQSPVLVAARRNDEQLYKRANSRKPIMRIGSEELLEKLKTMGRGVHLRCFSEPPAGIGEEDFHPVCHKFSGTSNASTEAMVVRKSSRSSTFTTTR
eukprot:TRINITY_DN3345_c0_g1_i1.p1 TRINITY_DN3345_c0_g1~~TRINITY_DN3345_c0_g1_i1.p1  ORF type:complete len:442 (-),score=88.80 TRINITY_DN3345_c0_g1_i1:105-1376(-)